MKYATLLLGLAIVLANIAAARAEAERQQEFECGKAKTVILREYRERDGDIYKGKDQKPLSPKLFRWGGDGDTLFYKGQRCIGPLN